MATTVFIKVIIQLETNLHYGTSYLSSELQLPPSRAVITVQNRLLQRERPVAKFMVPDREDKVNSGIGLSYRSARLHRLEGLYDNPTPESTISPSQNLATVPYVR